jgi:hypothetical protein
METRKTALDKKTTLFTAILFTAILFTAILFTANRENVIPYNAIRLQRR